MLSSHVVGFAVFVGIGATAVMDAWLLLLSRLGVPTASFALVGRWIGHFCCGRIKPDRILSPSFHRCRPIAAR